MILKAAVIFQIKSCLTTLCRISSLDMYSVTDEMFARVFPGKERDYFEKEAVENTKSCSTEEVNQLKAEIGAKYRDLNVCGDNWSGAATISAAQRLLKTGQHDLEVDWNVAPKQGGYSIRRSARGHPVVR